MEARTLSFKFRMSELCFRELSAFSEKLRQQDCHAAKVLDRSRSGDAAALGLHLSPSPPLCTHHLLSHLTSAKITSFCDAFIARSSVKPSNSYGTLLQHGRKLFYVIYNRSLYLCSLLGHQETVSQTSAGRGMFRKCCISPQCPVDSDKCQSFT